MVWFSFTVDALYQKAAYDHSMSYWSDLYAGDATKLLSAWRDDEPLDGTDGVVASVNLPGILPGPDGAMPNSPDLLTQLACIVTAGVPVTFDASIVERVDEEERGAYRLSKQWGAIFAALDDAQCAEVARRWMRECDPGADDGGGPLADLVRRIAGVCRQAGQRDASLIYTWTL